jgi:hydrogenase nickel incorporation protein HypA/HybF
MHEAGAAQAIVKMLEAEAAARGAARVERVRIVAGEAGAYMEASLAFYLGFFAKGGPVEGVQLDMAVVKPKLTCRSCGLVFERTHFSFTCPSCGGEASITDLADAFFIESAEFSGQAAASGGPDGAAGGAAPSAAADALSGASRRI